MKKQWIKKIWYRLFPKNRGEFCRDCGARGRHVLDCSWQSYAGAIDGMMGYYQAWIDQSNANNRIRRDVTLWEGKYRIVKHENNKLRKRLYEKEANQSE